MSAKDQLCKQAFPSSAAQPCCVSSSLLHSDHAQNQRVTSLPTSFSLSLTCRRSNPWILLLSNPCIQPLLSILSLLGPDLCHFLLESLQSLPSSSLPVLHSICHRVFPWLRPWCLHLTALNLLSTASQSLFSYAPALSFLKTFSLLHPLFQSY